MFDKAIASHGVPQRLLSDNGLALNPTRRGLSGQFVEHITSLGVEAITGKPTTQGKNERFHQTLFHYLDRQPLAVTLAELQAQVDAFDHIYNTERPHQALPGRVTPQTAWTATTRAEPPRPKAEKPFFAETIARRLRPPQDLPAGTTVRKLASNGSLTIAGVVYMVGIQYGFQHVLVTTDTDQITVADLDGEVLIEHTRAAPGIAYIGNDRPPGGPTALRKLIQIVSSHDLDQRAWSSSHLEPDAGRRTRRTG